jgi:DNA gyrase subunit B
MACPGQNQPVEYPVENSVEYSEEHIQALTGLGPIRRRPAMYIGSTDAHGLSHLLFEIITNSLAEAVAGYGRAVRIALRADGSAEVADDGRILPNDTAVDHVFALIGTGHRGYRPYPGGRDYLCYAMANALSERLDVAVRSDASRYQHSFRRGVTHVVLQSGGPPGDRGLTIAFRPDPLIFGDAQFDADAIRNRLRQLAFLHSGIRITFSDESTGTQDEFEYADGIREYVRFLNEGHHPLHPDVIVLRGEEQGIRYEVGLQWCADESEMRMSFANHYYTQDGGTHATGLRSGAISGLADFIRQHAPPADEFRGDDLRSGLTAVVSVWLREPQFAGARRTHLNNPEVETVVTSAVRSGVRTYFEANREAAERVVRAVVAARDARVAARAERQKKRQARSGE